MLGISRGIRRGALKNHSAGSEFAHFYVDPAGSDAANGTSQATAWQTAAKVNSASLASGNIVRFKRGGVWRETLGVPRSNITIGAYGTGAKPEINGADLRTSWTSEGGTARENFLDGAGSVPNAYWGLAETTGTRVDSGANGNTLTPGGTNAVGRTAGPIAAIPWAATFDGTNWLGRDSGTQGAGWPGAGADTSMTVGLWANANSIATDGAIFMGYPLKWVIGFDGATDKVSATLWNAAGTGITALSNAVMPTGTWVHIVLRWVVSGELSLFVNGVKQAQTQTVASLTATITSEGFRLGGGHSYFWPMNGSVAQPFVFNTNLSDSQIADIAAAGLGGAAGGAGIWYSTQTDWPYNQVFRNGGRLGLASSKGALAAGQYWYDDNNSRLYVFDNPAGATMEVSTRPAGIVATGVTDITLDGLAATKALRHGVDISRGSARITTSACYFTYNGQHGYAALTRSGDPAMANLLVTGCEATFNGDTGILAGSNVPNWRVASCTAHHNGLNPLGGAICGNILYTSRGLVGRRVDGYVAPPGGAVPIALGASIAAAILANPNGTAFALAAGTYTGQSGIATKPGNSFYGAKPTTPGTIATIIDGGGAAARAFFSPQVDNLTFANLNITNFSGDHTGSIMFSNAENDNWLMQNVAVSRCSNGPSATSSSTYRDCYFHHCGHVNFGGGFSTGCTVEFSEIAWGNLLVQDVDPVNANDCNFKVTYATNFTFRNNFTHHSLKGPGLWIDINCVGSLVEGNTAVDNDQWGIFVEIDKGAIVRNNFVARCGFGAWAGGAQALGGIISSTAQSGQYYNNDVFDNNGGIVVYASDRSFEENRDGTTYDSQNNTIRDNLVVLSAGNTGLMLDAQGTGVANNFTRNTYRLTGGAILTALNATRTFAAWQGLGQDPFSAGVGGVSLSEFPIHTAATGVSATKAAGVIIEDCVSYRAGYSASDALVHLRAQGIWVDGAGTGSTIRRNTSYQCGGAGIRFDNAGASSGIIVERNVAYSNGQGVVGYRTFGGVTVRHNTAYANAHNLWFSGEHGGETVGVANNAVQNNIGFAASAANLTVQFGANNTGGVNDLNFFQRNALGTAAAGFAVWAYNNPQSTYAGLDAVSGQTQTNIPGDPLFTNAATANFTLQAGSPCLNAATDSGNVGAI